MHCTPKLCQIHVSSISFIFIKYTCSICYNYKPIPVIGVYIKRENNLGTCTNFTYLASKSIYFLLFDNP